MEDGTPFARRELKTGTLVLGGSNLFSSWILPPLMADFAALYPQIQIRLVEESTVKLTEMLQSGSIDLVLDNTSLNPEIFDRTPYSCCAWLLFC